MLNEKDLQIFVEHLDCAFFVGDGEDILYSNLKAREIYGNFTKMEQLKSIFYPAYKGAGGFFLEDLSDTDFTVYYNQGTVTATGEQRLVDAHLGYYCREKGQIYLELFPKNQNPISTLKTILDDLRRPTLVTYFDDAFTLVYGNQPCEEMFGLEAGQGFAQLFPPLRREELFHQIHSTLEKEKSCYIQLQLLNKEGEQQWFALDIQRHRLGEQGESLIIVGHCIEEQMETQAKLQDIDSYFNILQTLTKGLLYRLDVEKRILFRNEETAKLYGIPSMVSHYPQKEHLEGVFHPDDMEEYAQFIEKVLTGFEGTHTARLISPSGQFEYHEFTFKQLAHPSGKLKEMVGTAINVNDMKETEDKLAVMNQYFDIIQSLSNDLLYRYDINKKILYRNEQTANFYHIESVVKNYPQAEILVGVFHPEDIEPYMSYFESVAKGIEGVHTARMLAPSGEFEYHKIHFKRVLHSDGSIKEMIGKAVNIQDLMELETKASYDMLTGVLNKISFAEQVGHILSHSTVRNRHALFFIDLDGFKGVNDSLGHSFGDYLLKIVGERLQGLVRGHDLVGRVGGDEFVVFLDSCGDSIHLDERAERILNALRQEISQDGVSATVRGSIGMAVFPVHGTTYETLYANADKALYESKRRGKDVATLYSEEA